MCRSSKLVTKVKGDSGTWRIRLVVSKFSASDDWSEISGCCGGSFGCNTEAITKAGFVLLWSTMSIEAEAGVSQLISMLTAASPLECGQVGVELRSMGDSFRFSRPEAVDRED